MKISLDNGQIAGMLANGSIMAEFPALNALVIEQRACCGRVTGRVPDFDTIRRTLAGLTSDKKAKLKELLNAEEVTIHYNDGAQVQTITF